MIQTESYPSREGDEEEGPVVAVEHPEQRKRVGQLGHRRPQAAEAGCDILPSRHAVMRRFVAQVVLDRARPSIAGPVMGGGLLIV